MILYKPAPGDVVSIFVVDHTQDTRQRLRKFYQIEKASHLSKFDWWTIKGHALSGDGFAHFTDIHVMRVYHFDCST